MTRIALIILVTLSSAIPARATELFSAAGAWTGEGRIATGPVAPLERGRCRVEIAPEATGDDVSITGQCAIAAGLSEISMRLVRGAGGKINAGFWTAATGATVQFAGRETDTTISLAATTPLIVDDTRYEARVEVTAPDPDGFALRQLLRREGETAWRLVVDMTYRPAGG